MLQDRDRIKAKLDSQGYEHVQSQFKRKAYAGWKHEIVAQWLEDNKPKPKAPKQPSEIKPKVETKAPPEPKKQPAKKKPAAKSKK